MARARSTDSPPAGAGKARNNSNTSQQAEDEARKADKHSATRFSAGPRPFWSGVVSFGLVTLPVSLYPANRGKHGVLHMVDRTGTQLKRRYQCAKEQVMLSAEEIVRGYEVEKDRFVTVEDDELKALAPNKSNEIDLQRFVALTDINPIYFEKGYFLAPDPDAIKAYRLLAQSMEEEGRAGIATFVMRDREYLVAIVAEAGILRAETLRFHDEIRSPGDIGLPDLAEVSGEQVNRLCEVFAELAAGDIDRKQLQDEQANLLQQKVDEKLKKKQDVITDGAARSSSTPTAQEYDEESADIIDLMEVIKARIRGEQSPDPSTETSAPPADSRKGKAEKVGQTPRRKTEDGSITGALAGQSRDDLYQQARKKNISGRSKMSKDELIQALLSAETSG